MYGIRGQKFKIGTATISYVMLAIAMLGFNGIMYIQYNSFDYATFFIGITCLGIAAINHIRFKKTNLNY